MDLKVVIMGMTIDSKDVGGEESLFRECKRLVKQLGRVRFTHVLNECNKCVGWLVNLGQNEK